MDVQSLFLLLLFSELDTNLVISSILAQTAMIALNLTMRYCE